jgi:uncharacterized 2Fe-2S/4Fe-4S cluster protein (DUF4445 family)
MNLKPLVFLLDLTVEAPSSSDKTADTDRISEALKRHGLDNVRIPLHIMRRLPEELRKNGFQTRCAVGLTGEGYRVLEIGKDRIYGIALDIGSTNMECSLFDLSSGQRLGAGETENPQMSFGSDVLSRVQRSMTGEFPALKDALARGIGRLIEEVCRQHGITAGDVLAVAVAGNTIMSHFFLGLDVRNIPLSPYVPAVNRAVLTSAEEAGLPVNRNATVYVFPNSGSYVGGDIISGILFSGVHREEAPVLFIDVGTNVEITLGFRDWIMVGAGAAGPALEGGVASIGKKAGTGTISDVTIDSVSRRIRMKVIGDTEPRGICGSGLISLVSELYSAGIIDQTGKFTGHEKEMIEKDGVKAYLLHRSESGSLYLTENEIRNFLLSKAAMFSFLYVFVRSVGLTFRDIKKVYVAGALGCGIDPGKAINIGMLPDIPRERFIPVGNSSLGGAEMVLLNRDLVAEVGGIAARITYREMNEDSDLMNMLQGAMFIPHTEPEILKG